MKLEGIKALAPVGPHVEGIIRFSYEEATPGERQQLPEFELLTRVHQETPKIGEIPRMVPHPLADTLIHRDSKEEGHRLIKEVPIRFLGNTPQSILSARFQAFDTSTGRMVCNGDGEHAVQKTAALNPPVETACTGPEACTFANQPGVKCSLHCRLKVQVEGSSDPLAVFEFQSSGINTYRTLAAKLNMLHALFGNLRGLPFRLTSWSKSSAQSLYKPFFAANIELRDGMTLASTQSGKNDAFEGMAPEAMEKLEDMLVSMAKDSVFELDGAETVVTTWRPSAAFLPPRANAPTGNELGGPTVGLADVVKRARETSNHAASSVKNVVAVAEMMVQSDGDAKITAAITPEPVSGSPVSDPEETCDNICI